MSKAQQTFWTVAPPKTYADAINLFSSDALLDPIYQLGFEPGRQQRDLIAHTLEQLSQGERQCLFPGAAGTGKTTTIKVLIRVLKDCNKSISCATPTWKAASRAKETLGEENKDIVVTTLHRVVYAGAEEHIDSKEITNEKGEKEIVLEEFGDELLFSKRDEGSATVGDILLIDEASMIGSSFAGDMWEALPSRTQVIAIGDHHQLPPVKENPGFPLHTAKIELTEVYRQAEGSPVLQAATKIREEKVPFTYSRCGANFRRGDAILKESGVIMQWQGSTAAGNMLAKMYQRTNEDAAAIVGTHRTRVALNDSTRNHLGFGPRHEGPGIGERLICRAGGANLKNSDMVKVLEKTHLDFGGRFGDGWILRVETEDGYEKEVAVLRETWESTYEPKFRGLVPRSIREEMNRFCEQDEQKYGPQIAEVVNKQRAGYEQKKGEEAPTWLVGIWTAQAARTIGAYALYLKKYLGSLDSGYAITCHAAQGSQFREIIVVADMVDFIAENQADQVYRWSYTALTRAEEQAIIIKKSKGQWD